MTEEKTAPLASSSPMHGLAKTAGLAEIHIPLGRGRKDFAHVPQLAESIKRYGLMHPPLVMKNPEPVGRPYVLVSGESRLRACIMCEYTRIPVVVREDLTVLQAKELELEENVRRTNLDWFEEVELVRQIDELKRVVHGEKRTVGAEGWSQEKTASLIGKSKSAVSGDIALAELFKARPDIAERVRNLPQSAAKKEIERIQEAERLSRLIDSGQLKFQACVENIDAVEGLSKLSDASIDLVLTDPPFGIEALEDSDDASYKATLLPDDNSTFEGASTLMEKCFPHFARVLKPGSYGFVFHCSQMFSSLSRFALLSGLEFQQYPVVWYKGRTCGPFKGYEFAACYEPIFFFWKPPRSKRLSGSCKAMVEYPPVSSTKKIHPFEKPRDLLNLLIGLTTERGQTVLDPFCGSGSTIISALDLGRSGKGFELSKDRFLRAQSRLTEFLPT